MLYFSTSPPSLSARLPNAVICIDLSYGVKCEHKFLSFCHNSRVWQTDRQT